MLLSFAYDCSAEETVLDGCSVGIAQDAALGVVEVVGVQCAVECAFLDDDEAVGTANDAACPAFELDVEVQRAVDALDLRRTFR